VTALLEMGNYGGFVWSAYGLSALVLILLAGASWWRQRRLAKAAERARGRRRGGQTSGLAGEEAS